MKKRSLIEWIDLNPVKSLLLLIFIFIFVIPLVTGYFIANAPFNLIPGTNNNDWLGYWSTYGGNVIGLLSLAVVTIYQDRKQKKYISDQNKIENLRVKVEMTSAALKETLDNISNINRDIKINTNLYLSKSSALLFPDIDEASELNQYAFITLDEITHQIDSLIELVSLSSQLSSKNKVEELPKICMEFKSKLFEYIKIVRIDIERSEDELKENRIVFKRIVNESLIKLREIDTLVYKHHILQTKYYIQLVNMKDINEIK